MDVECPSPGEIRDEERPALVGEPLLYVIG
jgi:hypothetical protein